ncbi:Hypothetical protein R9X50_00052500 [Acrodontium crateriforme]|uniref:Uncharacterized protein n=1 Tax=Acrodontium crateriforme TaxID=150365 RepID=A0AAQ3LXM8_9PEZI|nr:Hypothetical protein R9X50_00052500 [Acrodontium crateriforme]
MSINWVMLSQGANPPYTPLPNEQSLFTSPPRVVLSLSTPAHYPGAQQEPFSVSSASGIVYLTNRRVIYLPDKPTEKFKSFSTPLLNLHDSHITSPFFGPNAWIALLQPVQGGGIPAPRTGVVELKLTFKDGGAFDYHTIFERVKERLQQTIEVSRMEAGGGAANTSTSQAALNGVDISNVNLDELPAYQEQSDGPLLSPVAALATQQAQRHETLAEPQRSAPGGPTTVIPPAEPPPGYEEAQMQGLQEGVERRL